MDQTMIESLIAAFVTKNLEQVLSFFAEDALLYDPHYPVPERKGKAAIRRGIEWGLGNLVKPGFQIRNFWLDGDKAVVEVDTHHVFRGGIHLDFPQVFVIEAQDGMITRLQSYVPYPPHGIAGILSRLTRLLWEFQGKVV